MNEELEKSIKLKLSNFLIYYMNEKHISRRGIAALTGLSVGTIKNYVDQEALPFPDALFQMQVTMQVDILNIIGLSSKNSQKKEELIAIKKEIDDLMNAIIDHNTVDTMQMYHPAIHQSVFQIPVPDLDPEQDIKLETKNVLRKNISEMILAFEKENNINHIELANRIGIHKSKITAYVKMNSTPALSTLLEMAKIMQIPLDLFFLSRETNESVKVFESVRDNLSLYYSFLMNQK